MGFFLKSSFYILQTALHYYANMNALQYKRKIALLEPIMGYLHALRSTFSVGQETLNTPELEVFLTNIGSGVQGFVCLSSTKM